MVRVARMVAVLGVGIAVAAGCSSGGESSADVDSDPASDPLEFCVRYAAMVRDGFLQPDEVLGASSAQIREAIDGNVSDVRFAAEVAPDEVAADIETMVAGAEQFRSLLSQYGFDLVRLTNEADPAQIEEIQELLTGADFEAAAERIDAYLNTECAGLVEAIDDAPTQREQTVANELRGTFSEAEFALLFQRYDVDGIDGLVDLIVSGEVTVDDLLTAAVPDLIFDYGDDAALDALWDDCDAGDMTACDRLRLDSIPGSGYARFGFRCGDRLDGANDQSCVTQLGERADAGPAPTTTAAVTG